MSIKGNIPLCFGRKNEDDFDLTYSKGDGTYVDKCTTHWHDCFEIICGISGRRTVELGLESFVIEPGDIAVVPPGTEHCTGVFQGEPFETLVYGYTGTLIYTPDISLSNLRFLTPFRTPRPMSDYILRGGNERIDKLKRLLLTGWEIFKGHDQMRGLRMRANILEVHTILCEIYSIPERMVSSCVADAQNYIEDRLPGQISPYEIAEALHMSYSNFCRVVKAELGITPSELIASMRVELAEQTLTLTPTMSVTECAFATGFADSSHFIRRFREFRGMSPGEFLRTLKDSLPPLTNRS